MREKRSVLYITGEEKREMIINQFNIFSRVLECLYSISVCDVLQVRTVD